MNDRPSERESRLIEFLHSVDEPAPERLHRRVAELTDASPRARGALRSPLGLRVGLAGMSLTAALVAIVLALGGGSSGPGLTLHDATSLTLRGATLAAPAENAAVRTQLTASVEGVAFPYWGHFGWRASGARRDELGGHVVRTVFYTSATGERVGYAIVAGTSPSIGGGVVNWHDGTPYRLLHDGEVSVVTWVRGGRRCVVSGRGVSTATLLRLASWDDRQAA